MAFSDDRPIRGAATRGGATLALFCTVLAGAVPPLAAGESDVKGVIEHGGLHREYELHVAAPAR